ncbi:elongation factor G [Desulfofundulus thermosubterraneus]|uniref:Elongation factor G n=1 Tax=Desulfofundulus thermosubterraneus DSM 16057 TaxID=1121432 RepID=A0A1M6DGA6_9FIRM|nr:elongation factor G [Desulfofundulus thermosubterraneus]SHI72225.1 elongation factor G [Desulfofundulus thermosubterraneus DSM 16057]
MKNYQTSQIRNIGVVAHGGAGKTSLVEAMLFNTGAITRLGRVEDGTTTADYHPEEINRQVTIHTSLVPCEWQNCKLNLLDTPGYSDFIGEVYGVVRVVETALFVVSAVDGVQVQTEVIWDLIEQGNQSRVVFINKMDRENANFYKVLDDLQAKFKANFAPMQLPIGQANDFVGIVDLVEQKAYSFENGKAKEVAVPDNLASEIPSYREKLIEAAVEADDELMMKYLEGEELSSEEIKQGLQKGVIAGKVVPILCGSATKNIGVTSLMDFLVKNCPAPPVEEGVPFSSLVFKTLADPYVGKMNFIRIFTGTLKSDTVVLNSTKEKQEKIGQILYVRGKNSTPTTEVPTGDIAVLVKLQDTSTGDTLCDKDHPVKLEGINFPEPTLTVAIQPKSKGDEDKLGDALSKLLEEDPTVRVEKNTETKQTLLTGMGELHLDILLERLKRKYGVDVNMDSPKVPYRETIRAEVKVEGKHKKQTGGRGQYGHVWLRLEPLADAPFEFTEEIFGGAVPKQYIPAVEKGVREAMQEGVLAGYPVTGVKVVLYDGSFHPVDSSELAFKIAASMAFKKGQQQAKPVLLEPIMEVEVTVPENFMGDVISDFNTKRGRILGMEAAGKNSRVKALVPLAEMYRYAIDLKSMTQGRGSFRMKFYSYEEVPARLAEEIIKKAKAAAEAEK